MTWWQRFNRFLTPQRQSYAWLMGGALWLAWLVSIFLGPHNMDLQQQVVGTDYVQFYAAGQTLLAGQPARLYDFTYQKELEQAAAGQAFEGLHAFITPPFLAWLYAPFAALPYGLSFALWSLCGLALLWFSLRWLGLAHPGKTLAWMLTWYPVFASISFGQNSLLSLGLISASYALWRRDKMFLSGIVLSLVLYKPQLALGIGLLWLLEWRRSWRALAGLSAGAAALAALSFGLLPEASRAYVTFARSVLPGLTEGEGFPIWNAHTLRAFWVLLLPGQSILANGLTVLFSALGMVVFWRFWQQWRAQPGLSFAAAIVLTLWITPHAMIYDWVLLAIPAVFIWTSTRPGLRPLWRTLYALMWVGTLLSSPLTYGQVKWLPIAVQASLILLLIVIWIIHSTLTHESPNESCRSTIPSM